MTTSDPKLSSGTFTVTATLSDNQSLGIEAFEINVLGSANGINGVTVLPASNFLNTLQVSNPPYSTARSNGTPRAPNLTQIYASQDIITAAGNRDPSGLRFGDGLVTSATSSVYGVILPGGPLVLASGRWVANGSGGTMQAILTPGAFFNLFPLKYAVDDGKGNFNPPPAGAMQNAPFASNVFASTVATITPTRTVPEPTSCVLLGIGAIGLLSLRRRLKLDAVRF